MDAVSAYLTLQVRRRAASSLRRWWPVILGIVVLVPLVLVLLLAGAVSTVTRGGSDQAVLSGSCSVGGATAARNVSATWNGGLPFTRDQVQNAQTIVGVGRSKGVPPYGWVVAVAAAMTESTLTNRSNGDRDSVGLFQMRPSMGWGTPAQLQDPTYAATKFYDVLATVDGWEGMPVTVAAQAVERSGFPDAYAANEAAARALVGDPVVAGAACLTVVAGGGPGSAVQQRVVAAAMAQLGVDYAWGGGDWNGPTYGIDYGSHTFGFDCSGLTGYAWYQGSGGTVAMGTFTGDQEAATVSVDKANIQAGDLLFFPGHVGMYDGRGGMIHAPHTGTVVQVAPNILQSSYWMGRLRKIGRPIAYTTSAPGTGVAAAGSHDAAPAPAPRRRRDGAPGETLGLGVFPG